MAVLGKRKRRFLPGLLIVSLILSTTPILDGCSRSEPEAPSAAAPSTAPSVAPAPPAAQAPPPSAAPSPMAAQAPPAPNPAAEQPGPPPGGATAAQLQELVAPIALYPDLLIAQILAASTYPTQVVEAARFMKNNRHADWRRAGGQGQPPAVGPQRQIAVPVPVRVADDERQPVMDLGARRGLLQSARRRDGRYPGDAQARDGRRHLEEHAAAESRGPKRPRSGPCGGCGTDG